MKSAGKARFYGKFEPELQLLADIFLRCDLPNLTGL